MSDNDNLSIGDGYCKIIAKLRTLYYKLQERRVKTLTLVEHQHMIQFYPAPNFDALDQSAKSLMDSQSCTNDDNLPKTISIAIRQVKRLLVQLQSDGNDQLGDSKPSGDLMKAEEILTSIEEDLSSVTSSIDTAIKSINAKKTEQDKTLGCITDATSECSDISNGHKSIDTIDECTPEIKSIPKAGGKGSWPCNKCNTTNHSARKRCTKCMSWRGGRMKRNRYYSKLPKPTRKNKTTISKTTSEYWDNLSTNKKGNGEVIMPQKDDFMYPNIGKKHITHYPQIQVEFLSTQLATASANGNDGKDYEKRIKVNLSFGRESTGRSVLSEEAKSFLLPNRNNKWKKERPKKRRVKVGRTRLLPGTKQIDKVFDDWLDNRKSEWKKKRLRKKRHRALLLDTGSNISGSDYSDIMKELVHKAALAVRTINEEDIQNKKDGHSNISILANETVPYLMASIKRPRGRPRKDQGRGKLFCKYPRGRICVYEGCGRYKQWGCKGYCMAHHTMIQGEKKRKKLIVRRRSPKKWSKLVKMKGKPILKKKAACGQCDACSREDCGECIYCLDKPKFGGASRIRQRCIKRQCLNMRRSRMIKPLVKESARSLADTVKEWKPDTVTEDEDDEMSGTKSTSSSERQKFIRKWNRLSTQTKLMNACKEVNVACGRAPVVQLRKRLMIWLNETYPKEVKASARLLAGTIIERMKIQRPRGRPRKNQDDLGSRKRRRHSSLEQPVSAKSSNQYAKIYNPSIRGKKIRITGDAVEAVAASTSSLVEAIIEEESIDPSDLKVGSRVLVDDNGVLFNATIYKRRQKMGVHEVLIHYDVHRKTTLHWVSADRVTYILPQSDDKPKKRKRRAKKRFASSSTIRFGNDVSSSYGIDMTTDSTRRRTTPKRFVARPSKSGEGVEDGDKEYLATAVTIKPPMDKKRVDNSIKRQKSCLGNNDSMVKKGGKYLVGTPVQKVFNAEEDGRPRPFWGEVVSYCSDTKLYLIRYEDKDEEEILEEEMDTIAMDPSSRKRRARARRQKERELAKALVSKKNLTVKMRKEATRGVEDDNTARTVDNWATFKPRRLVWARDGAELHPALLLSADRGKNGNAVIEWASTQRVVTVPKSRISFALTSRPRRIRNTSPPTSHAPKNTRKTKRNMQSRKEIKSEPVTIKREDSAYDEDTDKEEEEEEEKEMIDWTRVKEEDTDDEGSEEKDTNNEEQVFMPDMPTSDSNISRERDNEVPKTSESSTDMAEAEDVPQTNTAAAKSKGNVKSSRGQAQKPPPLRRQLVWARDNQNSVALHPAYLIREDRGRYGNAEIEWASTHRIATVPKANITWELQSRSRRG